MSDDNSDHISADIEAIKQLKARYFRLMDTKDWAGFRAVFTDFSVHIVRYGDAVDRPALGSPQILLRFHAVPESL